MKALVTGGAGFIGSHVCDALLERGHEVCVIDDLSSGKRKNLDPRVRLFVHDLRSPEAAERIVAERPEAIFHLAAQMDVRRSVADPRFDADVNIGGLLNLMEAAAKAGTKRVVFSSTGGAIYGEQDEFPATESHPTRPCSPYGVSKAASEIYLQYYGQQYGISWIALRYANVYGPRQNAHGEAGVVAIFSERMLRGEPCTIFGDGRQTRDFVYVGDVARANVLALESDHQGAVNIGTALESELLSVYGLLAKAARYDHAPQMAPARPGEQRRSVIAFTKAARVLRWTPETSLETGLVATVRYFGEAQS